MNTKGIIAIVAIIIVGLGAWLLLGNKSSTPADTATTTAQNQGAAMTSSDTLAPNDQYMVGAWQSNDDAKFIRTFKADGTVSDTYTGDASATDSGTYVTVDPATEAGFPAPAANFAGMSVIKMTFAKGGVMYFGINELTDTSLKMTYISGRGNILSFTRMR